MSSSKIRNANLKILKNREFFFWNAERFVRFSFNQLKYIFLDQIMNNDILYIHKII